MEELKGKKEKEVEEHGERDRGNRNTFTINKRMIPSKFVYILYGGNLGSQVAFLNIFFQTVGLSQSQAGMITGFRFVASTICQPIWGTIADYTGRRKLVLIILCIGSALPLFSLPWISKWIYTPSHYSICNGLNTTSLLNVTQHAIAQCEIDEAKALNTLFYTLLVIVSFTSTFLIPLPGYIEAIVMEVVKSVDDGAHYGTQRVFGSLGFSLANCLAGLAAQHYHVKDMSPYTAVFFLYLPYTLMIIPVGSYLINQAKFESATEANDTDDLHEKSTMCDLVRDVFAILRKMDTVVFMGTVFVTGLANNFFLNFTYPYVKQEMHRTETEMTLVVTTGTVAEAAIFPFTAKILHLVGGNNNACIIGLFSYFIRFLIMGLDQNFALLVAIQTLHCLGFALAFHAIMECTHAISPPHLTMTMNSIVMMLFFSVSNIVANVLGGHLAELYPVQTLFFWHSIICATWVFLLVLYYGGRTLKTKLLRKLFASSPSSVSYDVKRDSNHSLAFENPINCVSDENDTKMRV